MQPKRIAWGKFINAGQTCVAPDYIFAHESISAELIELIQAEFKRMLAGKPLAETQYGKIVSKKAFDRLVYLAQDCGLELATDEGSLKIAPVVFAANEDSPALAEEIFGPLLPVLSYQKIETVIEYVRNGPKPLACYLFTGNKELEKQIIASVLFGGGCINDVALQASSCHLPFGGVGQSGLGRYHGKAGFDLFSNHKSIVKQWKNFDLPLRYPPYSIKQFEWIKQLLK